METKTITHAVCMHAHKGETCEYSTAKGAPNGFKYGFKVRVAHAFVMSLLFRGGSVIDMLKWAIKMAFNHGMLLAIFVPIYKGLSCFFRRSA